LDASTDKAGLQELILYARGGWWAW
jgi:hypothetical protein